MDSDYLPKVDYEARVNIGQVFNGKFAVSVLVATGSQRVFIWGPTFSPVGKERFVL